MKTGIDLIREERERQVSEENYSPKHDDKHKGGELTMAGACYAFDAGYTIKNPGKLEDRENYCPAGWSGEVRA